LESLAAVATAHLILCLQPINRALRAAVEHQKSLTGSLARPDLSPLCITDEHIEILLDGVDAAPDRPGVPAMLSPEERDAEAALRARAASIGASLPLDRMARPLGLSPFEQEALLLCAAPELDRNYERIYAFILDDLNRRLPCLELLVSLTAGSVEERITRRHALARSGRLRRLRVLRSLGDPVTDLRQEFRLAPDVFDFLTGSLLDLPSFCRDHAAVAVPDAIEPPSQISADAFAHLSDALVNGRVLILGVWGPRRNGGEEVVMALAAAARRPLRRMSIVDLDSIGAELPDAIEDELKIASALQAYVWIDSDTLADPRHLRVQHILTRAFAGAPVPILITGEQPWRPRPLLRFGAYAEIEPAAPVPRVRGTVWSRNFPELEQHEIESLAGRYSLSTADSRSVSRLARTRAQLAGNGVATSVRDHVAAACAVMTRQSASHYATVVEPKRGPEDLVLPANLHQQVVEVANFFRLHAHVDEDWGFGRLSGGAGVRALFTGDPGTGKTLAAEVIASVLRLVLYKVDLARVVSKWVGETEKNLEIAFREAEESHAVLFFDEADALFGRRGEIQHGTDRYANLEVSYLLQRLEQSRGLVILASNVKDQIDAAFIRRFQIVMHFPRPGLPERRRLWELAVPKAAPVDPGVDLEALARLDMTGAGIVTSARTAALLAADAGSATITMADMVRATARQFRREARLLTPSELGPHGSLLQGAP
jgi:hypothetical protein